MVENKGIRPVGPGSLPLTPLVIYFPDGIPHPAVPQLFVSVLLSRSLPIMVLSTWPVSCLSGLLI